MRKELRSARVIASIACGCAILSAHPAAAQSGWTWGLPGSFSLSAATGATFERYTFSRPDVLGARSVSLYTIPLDVAMPLVGRSRLEFHGAYAHGKLERGDGSETTLSGVTDSRLSVALPVGSGRWGATLQAVALLPTGRETLTRDEAGLVGVLASDLLPFSITDWGSGGAAGLSVSGARAFGNGSIGLGASYLMARRYQPISEFYYQPGDQMSFQIAADRNVGNASKITIAAQYQHFGADQSQTANIYNAGDRLQAMGSLAFPLGPRSSVILYVGGVNRAAGEALDANLFPYPRQRLLLVGGGGRIRVGRATLVPVAGFRYVNSDSGRPDGELPTVGGSIEWPLGPAVFSLGARAGIGAVGQSDVRGTSFSLNIRSPLH